MTRSVGQDLAELRDVSLSLTTFTTRVSSDQFDNASTHPSNGAQLW
jgi:hypothetical protein